MTGIEMAGVLEAGKKMSDLVEQIGMLDAIKRKLVKHPDIAATKLAAVLQEVLKSLLAFESEVVRFLSITLEPGPELRNDRATLYALEGQVLWARMQAARGHCSKIENIYQKYLDPWFQRIVELDRAERAGLQKLFEELSNCDGAMVELLDKATWWLGNKANQVIEVYEGNQPQEASKLIADASREIRPVRRNLTLTMARLQELEDEFISMGGVT